MDRTTLIAELNKAVYKAAKVAIQHGMPIPGRQSNTWVGNTVIKKNKDGLYDIFSLNKKQLFKDITVFDVATIISQRYTTGEFKTIEKVLALEDTYSKYRSDMLHYLHCIKGAKRRHDYDKMAILEDKFQVSEIRAKNTKNSIAIFKRLK